MELNLSWVQHCWALDEKTYRIHSKQYLDFDLIYDHVSEHELTLSV